MHEHTPSLHDAIDALRAQVAGTVHTPDEDSFGEATLAWNRAHVHRPVVVVDAEGTADVQASVRFARTLGLGLGVQATGHGVAAVVDGGVLLRTHLLDGVSVDADAATAWVEAGATWQPVLDAAQRHGLAPLLGSAPHVGAVGYTLGGGLGWLARKWGAAADHVRRFTVVLPDGTAATASPTEHPELFRALCGGGGGALAIVTAMEIGLFPVTTVYGGSLLYPADAAVEVFDAWSPWAKGAPDELTSSVVLMNYPPLPIVPEPLRGRSFVMVQGCWCGDLDEGRALVDELRAQLPPAMDLWREMPFSEVATISNDPTMPLPAVTAGGWLRGVDAGVAATLAAGTFATDGPPVLTTAFVRHCGGAIAADGLDTVMGHRDTPFLFHAVAMAPTPEAATAARAHLDQLEAALVGALTGGAYLNFVDGEERRRRLGDALAPGQRARTAAVQRALDPDRVLRYGVDHDA